MPWFAPVTMATCDGWARSVTGTREPIVGGAALRVLAGAMNLERETMCDFHNHDSELEPLAHDEYVLDTPAVRRFVATVQHEISHAATREEAIAAIEPIFVALVGDDGWLPAEYQHDAP